jgi:hypothetical protein
MTNEDRRRRSSPNRSVPWAHHVVRLCGRHSFTGWVAWHSFLVSLGRAVVVEGGGRRLWTGVGVGGSGEAVTLGGRCGRWSLQSPIFGYL